MTRAREFGTGAIRVASFVAASALLVGPVFAFVESLDGRGVPIGVLGGVGILVGLRLGLEIVTRAQTLVEGFAARDRRSGLVRFFAIVLDGFSLYLLSLTMVGLALIFYVAILLGALEVWSLADSVTWLGPAGGVVAVVAALFVLGTALERVLVTLLLRQMQTRVPGQPVESPHDNVDAPITGTHRLTFHLRDLEAAARESGEQRLTHDWVWRRARASRRFHRLQFVGPPLVAVSAAVVAALIAGTPGSSFVPALIGLSLAVVAVLVIVRWTGWLHQTPLRQCKLVLDVALGLLGVGMVGLAVLVSWGVLGGRREELWDLARDATETARQLLVSRHVLLAAAALAAGVLSLPTGTADEQESGKLAVSITAWIIGYGVSAVLIDLWRLRTLVPQTVELLYLRVFGDPRRSGFLVRQLEPRWRGAGRTACIAAPDVSGQTVDPVDISDLVFGRFRDRFSGTSEFEREVADLEAALTTERDGVSQIYCHDNTWKSTLGLMLQYPGVVVLMDLRGFGPSNRGCLYELQTLVFQFPLRALLLMVDESTDVELLRRSLDDAVARLPSWSPNHQPPAAVVQGVILPDDSRRTARELSALLFGVAAEASNYRLTPVPREPNPEDDQ